MSKRENIMKKIAEYWIPVTSDTTEKQVPHLSLREHAEHRVLRL